MAINLPGGRNVFLPSLPLSFSDLASVHEYMSDMKIAIEKQLAKSFENVYAIVNTGTTGTFVDSAGNTVTVTNGIITALA